MGFRKYLLPAFDTDGAIVLSVVDVTKWSSRVNRSRGECGYWFGLTVRVAGAGDGQAGTITRSGRFSVQVVETATPGVGVFCSSVC